MNALLRDQSKLLQDWYSPSVLKRMSSSQSKRFICMTETSIWEPIHHNSTILNRTTLVWSTSHQKNAKNKVFRLFGEESTKLK